jgi:hypothetical protein
MTANLALSQGKKDCLFFRLRAFAPLREKSTQINPMCLKSNQSQAESGRIRPKNFYLPSFTLNLPVMLHP